jgi:hypothetical protein
MFDKLSFAVWQKKVPVFFEYRNFLAYVRKL